MELILRHLTSKQGVLCPRVSGNYWSCLFSPVRLHPGMDSALAHFGCCYPSILRDALMHTTK
jgi:hypothetical protein